MKTMISKIAHIYDGVPLAAGQHFEAHDEFVDALQLLGRAGLAPIESHVSEYETRDMAAGAEAQYERRDAAATAAPHPKRKYNTKRKSS